MDEHIANGLMTSLEDAVAYMQGDTSRVRISKVPVLKIKGLRKELGLTQEQFARLIGSMLQTVALWEDPENTCFPSGSARKLLFLLQRKPELTKELELMR